MHTDKLRSISKTVLECLIQEKYVELTLDIFLLYSEYQENPLYVLQVAIQIVFVNVINGFMWYK